MPASVSTETYITTCWSCLGEFDALSAVWCSHDARNPSKVCPFCLRCFCEASEEYKREFWGRAPPRLQEDLQTLGRSRDLLGDILIRMKKITTPQLLHALEQQKGTDKKLGEIFVQQRLVTTEDIEAALRTQGENPLTDATGKADSARALWERSEPEAIIEHLLGLAARKAASDIQLEPREDGVLVKLRIDGFSFRLDPVPAKLQGPLTEKLFTRFRLDPAREFKPQTARSRARLGEGDYDLVIQTLPTTHGVSANIRLVNRGTFLKDLVTLGLELEDRVRLIEELRGPYGMILVTSPVFNGAYTTLYSLMSHLVATQRNVVSLESPVYFQVEGVRQVEVRPEGMADSLRSVVAVRPDVLMLSSLPDPGAARIAAQLSSGILVVASLTAPTAAQGIAALLEAGAPRQMVAGSLAAVTCQRLVRRICPHCRERAEPPAPRTLAHHGVVGPDISWLRFFRGKGCPVCNNVGYRGRRAVFEVLSGTAEVRAAILNALPTSAIQDLAVGSGMKTLRERCLTLVAEGVTTFDEFVRLGL